MPWAMGDGCGESGGRDDGEISKPFATANLVSASNAIIVTPTSQVRDPRPREEK